MQFIPPPNPDRERDFDKIFLEPDETNEYL